MNTSVGGAGNRAPFTSKRELFGWYIYDFASSVYGTVVLGGYLPNLLKDLALAAADKHGYVYIGGIGLRPVSFVTMCTSVACLLQILLFLCLGAMADYGNLRKRLLVGFSLAGSLGTVLMFSLASAGLWWFGGILLIASNVSYGACLIFYNAYLPLLVDSTPTVRAAEALGEEERLIVAERVSNKMSSYGFASGYLAGMLLLLVSVPVLYLLSEDTLEGYRICILAAGLWWFLFSLFTFAWLLARPGPPLPRGERYLAASFRQVRATLGNIRSLPHTALFLAAYFVWSDGYNTLATLMGLLADSLVELRGVALACLLVEVPLCAFLGNYLFLHLQFGLDVRPKTILFANLALLALLPVYGALGFAAWSPVGLKAAWEMYLFGALFGLNLGSLQSYSRSTFAHLIPPGAEAQFFAFYEMTERGSSLLGPALVSAVVQASGSLRWGLLSVLFFFVLPVPLLRLVDVDRGTLDARLAARRAPAAPEALDLLGPPRPAPPRPASPLTRPARSQEPELLGDGLGGPEGSPPSPRPLHRPLHCPSICTTLVL
eukprot:tig00000663_g2974.t1